MSIENQHIVGCGTLVFASADEIEECLRIRHISIARVGGRSRRIHLHSPTVKPDFTGLQVNLVIVQPSGTTTSVQVSWRIGWCRSTSDIFVGLPGVGRGFAFALAFVLV